MTEQINKAAPLHIHMPGPDPERPTLRDQFAMAALTGLLADYNGTNWKGMANTSYAIADAMMKERNKTAHPVEVKG